MNTCGDARSKVYSRKKKKIKSNIEKEKFV